MRWRVGICRSAVLPWLIRSTKNCWDFKSVTPTFGGKSRRIGQWDRKGDDDHKDSRTHAAYLPWTYPRLSTTMGRHGAFEVFRDGAKRLTRNDTASCAGMATRLQPTCQSSGERPIVIS